MKKLIAVVLMVLIAAPAMANILVDTFDQGPQYVAAGGSWVGDTYTGPGPLGGTRVIWNRHSGSVPNGARLDINGGSVSNPGELLATGGAWRQTGWGEVTYEESVGTFGAELNLNLPDDAAIEVDVEEVITPWANYPQVKVFFGSGNKAEYKLQLNTATSVFQMVSLDLMSPDWAQNGSVTSADLDDVDGIMLRYYDGAETRISEIRINDGAAPAVPEPAGLGLVGLALLAVRKRRS